MYKNIIFIPVLFTLLFSQDIRYLDEIFEEVEKTEDVIYGNAPDLPFIFFFEWNTNDIDLDMDIYAPCALGATLNPETIARLKCAIVSGAANNQLADEVKHNPKREFAASSRRPALPLIPSIR